jgi:uncharacterized YigZ family protein
VTDPETGETYRTLATVGESAFEVRGSEFFGYAAPARDVEAAEAVIEERRARYDDASHNVPAYRVRVGRRAEAPGADVLLREYSSDDGEPTSSAGKPALNVLQGRELENVVAVVTRYYGGTNLGIGGLVRSYSRAVNDAVEDAETTTERPHDSIRAVVDYDDSGTVRTVLESAEVSFEAEYAERVAFDVRVPVADAAALVERLRSATGGRVELE